MSELDEHSVPLTLLWSTVMSSLHPASRPAERAAPAPKPASSSSSSSSSASSSSSSSSSASSSSTPASLPVVDGSSTPIAEGETEDPATFEALRSFLVANGVEFRHLHHEPTRTSEESARVRGVSLASGSKAMLLRRSAEGAAPFVLAVMSAACKLDWKKMRAEVGRKVEMADVADVWRVTRCLPGAVPPFGSLFAGVETVVDQSLIDQGPVINFNAGLRTDSFSLTVAEYLRVEKPRVVRFVS